MKLSFGMIFSIILIIVFLVVAFYAIQKFMGLQKSIVYNQFLEEFQSDVEKVWKGQGSSMVKDEGYLVPSKIISICFVDDEFNNLKVNYKNKFLEEKINHLDMDKILRGKQEVCINTEESKIKMILQKDHSEPLVTIKKYVE